MKHIVNHNKLVRDNIPNIISEQNNIPIYYTLSDEQYWKALLDKDIEELQEIKKATSLNEVKEELADKLEVLIAIAKFNGFSLEDIIKEADIKRKKRGCFDKKIFLKKVINDK